MGEGGPPGGGDPYRTVAERGEAEFTVRGSEFIGHVTPVTAPGAVSAAEAFVGDVRERYPDASHVVPAYRVRDDDGLLREYADDDGEPTGSAGKPALNVPQQRDLENVVAAVVRYYGGTNLGVGGLARAYGRAVKEAIEDAGVAERRPTERFRATVDYDDSGTVRSILEGVAAADDDVAFEGEYGEHVVFTVRVPRETAPALRDRLRSATSGRVALE